MKNRFEFSRAAAAVALAMVFVAPALAAQAHKAPSGHVVSDKSWKGDPNANLTEAYGYFIWQDDNGWHVRWTTKGKKMRFEGSIQADGKIQQFEAVSPDDKDKIKKSDENTITFSTRTQAGIDGVNFRLADAVRTIRFDLKIDGVRPSTDRVKLGEKKRNPPGLPFTIDRKDEAKKHN